ncbi:MAG: outer membrane protein assembly factor BamB [Pseudomonadota bacterium]
MAADRVLLKFILLFTIALLAGCGWFSKDNTRVPTELQHIEQTLQVREVWQGSSGAGIGERYLRLYPMLVGERLYLINANGGVKAMLSDQGEPLWDMEIEAAVSAGLNGNEELLVFGTEEGDAIALSADDGRELWRKRLSSEIVAVSQADLGVVAVRTNDSKVYGLDTGNGEVIWQLSRKAPVLTLKGASVPIVNSGKLVVGFDDGKLGVFSMLSGNTLWQTTLGVPKGRSELERMVDIDSALKVRDGIIYAVGLHSQVAAITLIEGRVLWSREISSYTGLDVGESRVFVTDEDDQVWALDRRTGASLWKQEKLKYRKLTSPAAIQDFIVVGDFEGYVHWLAKSDGHLVARTPIGSDGILTTPKVVESRAYVLGKGGDFVVLDIASEQE